MNRKSGSRIEFTFIRFQYSIPIQIVLIRRIVRCRKGGTAVDVHVHLAENDLFTMIQEGLQVRIPIVHITQFIKSFGRTT